MLTSFIEAHEHAQDKVIDTYYLIIIMLKLIDTIKFYYYNYN